MAITFEKRNTQQEISILGNLFHVDLGRDGVAAIIQNLEDEVKEIEERHKQIRNAIERSDKIDAEEKVVFKKAINNLLGDAEASDKIFKEDDSALLHADVYIFLVDTYVKIVAAEEK